MIVLGIDIGVTGALAAVDARGTCSVADLPTVGVDGNRVVKRKVSAVGVRDLVLGLTRPGDAVLAVIEDVHMGMGPGAAARSSLDLNRGRIEAVLELLRVTVHAVPPRVWQRWYGIKAKGDALDKARALYPLAESHLARKKDHNRADALLLAHFGQRTMT